METNEANARFVAEVAAAFRAYTDFGRKYDRMMIKAVEKALADRAARLAASESDES